MVGQPNDSGADKQVKGIPMSDICSRLLAIDGVTDCGMVEQIDADVYCEYQGSEGSFLRKLPSGFSSPPKKRLPTADESYFELIVHPAKFR